MRALAGLVPVLLLAACGGSTESADTAMVAPPPAVAPEAPGTRDIDSAESDAMLDVLRADTASEKKVWLIVAPGSPGTVTLGKTLETIFREGGWQAATRQLTGMTLKPGPVKILVAEELEPPAVDTVRRALEAGGLTTETGTGYRAYYDERKRDDPNWAGIPLEADQAFMVVIAPPAKS